MLRGTLDDFSMPEILRLMSSKKTGRLEVKSDRGDATLYFRDGIVYYAQSSASKEPIGRRLVRAGYVTEEKLREALEIHKKTGKRLSEVLIGLDYISRARLEQALRDQIEDTVVDLFRWENGEFGWHPDAELEVEVPLSVRVEDLIMEGTRRLGTGGDREMIARRVPSPDSVPSMTPHPPADVGDINIKADEWRVLVMADGSRTIREIAVAVDAEEFAVMRTFYGLSAVGLVEIGSERVQRQGQSEEIRLDQTEAAEEIGRLSSPSHDVYTVYNEWMPSESQAEAEQEWLEAVGLAADEEAAPAAAATSVDEAPASADLLADLFGESSFDAPPMGADPIAVAEEPQTEVAPASEPDPVFETPSAEAASPVVQKDAGIDELEAPLREIAEKLGVTSSVEMDETAGEAEEDEAKAKTRWRWGKGRKKEDVPDDEAAGDEAEQSEQQRLEAERLEQERLEHQRLEAERRDQERLEQERLERERAEAERLDAERLEAERLEAERREQEGVEAERLEQERLEQERLEQERLEQERLEAERREQERLEAEQLEAQRQEMARLERERAEAERQERQRLEAEQSEQERLEAARLEQERLEAERLEAERLEQERLEAERREQERLEAERVEAERLEQERLEAERLEAERREQERLEAERVEAERLEQERLEAERLEAERLEQERLEAERREQERLEAERLEAERLAALAEATAPKEIVIDPAPPQGPPPAPSRRKTESDVGIDRASAIRELASLFDEEESNAPPPRPRARGGASNGDPRKAKEPDDAKGRFGRKGRK